MEIPAVKSHDTLECFPRILKKPGDDDDDDGDDEDKAKVDAKKPVDIFDFDGESLEAVEPLECNDEDGKMLRSEVKENGVDGEKKGRSKRGGKKQKRKKDEEDNFEKSANDINIQAVDARAENLRVIASYLKSKSNSGSAQMPTEESVRDAVEKFHRDGKMAEKPASTTYIPPPKEVLESLRSYLDENEYLLKSGLDDVRQRLQDLSLEDCLTIARGEMPVPQPPAPIEETPQIPEYSQDVFSDFGGPNFDHEGETLCSEDLVHLLPHQGLREWEVYDQGSLNRWLFQVQENAEFLRFMEFKKKMEELERQRNQWC